MRELNLYKLWEVCNKLSEKMEELSEDNKYIYLLGRQSNFGADTFESFLDYYSFKIEQDEIIVFNNDGVPYESYTNDDFSYIPLFLLFYGEKDLEIYMENEITEQLQQQQEAKIQEKEDIKRQIELLKKKLNN